MSRAARQLRGKTRITFHEVGDLISFYVYLRFSLLSEEAPAGCLSEKHGLPVQFSSQ